MVRCQRSPSPKFRHSRRQRVSHRLRTRVQLRDHRHPPQLRNHLPQCRQPRQILHRTPRRRTPSTRLRRQIRLRHRHHLDVQLIAPPRIIIKSKQPVLQQHHSLNPFRLQITPLDDLINRPRQDEPRHHIRHHDHPIPKTLLHPSLPIRVARQRRDRVRVTVVHKSKRQHRMQNRLNARRRRIRIRHRRPLLRHHVRIRHRLQLRHLQQRAHPHRCKPRPLDRRQIPARPLHMTKRHLIPKKVLLHRLHRRVSTPVQHQSRVPPQQTRRVNTLSQRVGSKRGGFLIVPK